MSATQGEELEEAFKDRKKTYKEIKLLIDKLGDKYTTFFAPSDYRRAINRPTKEEAKYLEAINTGVGLALKNTKKSDIALYKNNGGLLVEAVGPATPAEEAGIQRGDVLVAVDGIDVINVQQATKLLHGVAGSTVKARLQRSGVEEVQEVTMERRQLTVEPVRSMLLIQNESAP